jgi:DNA-binding SARP family transcriptional activator/tetratricopeptide (TPR) repeat protein
MLQLRTLGGLALQRDGTLLDQVNAQRKALALLAVLAAAGASGVGREKVMLLLWPESDAGRARGALKQMLHVLRRQLGSPDAILGTTELHLNPRYVESDVARFRTALDAGDFEAAVSLYDGPFLDGVHVDGAPEFQEWADRQRTELEGSFREGLERLARAAEARGDAERVIALLRRLQVSDPLNGRVAVGLMEALEASGDRAAALRHARIHETLLREEWGLEPDPAVAALAARLRVPVDPPPQEAATAAVRTGASVIAGDEPVQRLLSKDPARRYASAERVAAELLAVSHDLHPPRRHRISSVFEHRRRTLAAAALFVAVLAAIGAGVWLLSGVERRSPDFVIVAVVPFQTEGEPDGYLASGLTDAFATHLSRLRAVAVPSDFSMAAHHGSAEPLPQIAQELEVDAVIRVSVRRAGDIVRLDIELFDARARRQARTRTFERPVAQLLELQRDAAQAVVAALRIDLAGAERARLASLPTTNAEAYDLYLRARAAQLRRASPTSRVSTEDFQRAQSLLATARELDPDFAIARAHLAMMHMVAAALYDRTQARRDQARLEAETALRLQPDLPEAHDALARYWFAQQDLTRFIEHLRLALAGFPNRSMLHLSLALALRSLGRWDEAVSELDRAVLVDPRNRLALTEAALTYGRLRRYHESIGHWDRLLAIGPADAALANMVRGHNFVRLGLPDSLEVALTRIPPDWDVTGQATFSRYFLLRIQARPDAALALLDSARHEISQDGNYYNPVTLMRATVLQELGRYAEAATNFEAARALLEDSVAAHPESGTIRVALGLAYAGLGRPADAVREARKAMEATPLTGDNSTATAVMGSAVDVFIRAGETGAALELLELMLSMPAGREVSVPLLRIDPTYDALRSDPRFDQLIERFSHAERRSHGLVDSHAT